MHKSLREEDLDIWYKCEDCKKILIKWIHDHFSGVDYHE
jgi:hypothetical protein